MALPPPVENSTLRDFVINTVNNLENGEHALYPDPAEPSTIGGLLTQAEIDTLKRLVAELKRYDTISS